MHHKLSVEGSAVVWVQSKGHYMEIRRGSQTKFTAAERRYWLSVEEWVASLTPPPAVTIKVDEVEAPVPVPVVEAVVLAAPAPAAVTVEAKPAFDAAKYKDSWGQLCYMAKKETGTLRSAYIIQLCQFLLDTRPAAADWLAENPIWRYSARAIVQDFSLNPGHKVAHDAVDRFLEKF
jgi:hypothetical protein